MFIRLVLLPNQPERKTLFFHIMVNLMVLLLQERNGGDDGEQHYRRHQRRSHARRALENA